MVDSHLIYSKFLIYPLCYVIENENNELNTCDTLPGLASIASPEIVCNELKDDVMLSYLKTVIANRIKNHVECNLKSVKM